MPRILTQMRFIFGLAAIVCLPFCMSCSTPLPPPSETEQETADAALEILSQSQTNEILNAFDEIATWSYTRHDRTENRTAREYESFTRQVRFDTSGSATVIMGSDSVAALDLSGLAEAMIPDDVPYLMDRFKDEFSYQIREDTTYWTRPAYEIIIQARPGSAQEGITASYMYDAVSDKLISANLHNFDSTILFGESSRYQLQLRPIGAAWVPHRLSAHVILKLPFGQEQIFARNVTFYDYTPRSTN